MVGQNHKSDGFDRRRFITRANAEVWHPFRMHCLRHPLPVVIPGKRRNDHRLPSVNPPGKEHRAARCRDISGDGGNKFGTTALRLGLFGGRQPRVARSSQSWALRQNPLGFKKAGSHPRDSCRATVSPRARIRSNDISQLDFSLNKFCPQGDGKMLFGGIFTTLSGTNRSRLGRINVDGTIDSSFDPAPIRA